ncbi:MAG: PQQ-dependent sugar dehydrogenase [Thermoanaerobaculia bacterium]|nr:PQQ-dependent sugar dehydrogenase [Thermoanaerobaculia bacterium]
MRRPALAVARGTLSLLGLPILAGSLLAQDEPVDFESEVRPLLATYCWECHGPNRAMREADLRLDRKSFAFADLGGYHAIVPGEPGASEMYLRMSSEFAEDRMPPYTTGVELDFFEIDVIRRWIAQGAEWPEEVDDRPPRTLRAGGLPPVELPTQPVIVNTHEIPEVRMRVITQGLSHPWSIAFLPKGDVLVTERAGRLRLIRDGVLMPDPIEGVPRDVLAKGLSGLMEVAPHPDFEQNHLLYLSYTRRLESTGTVALVRGRLEDGVLRDVEDVFVVEPWMGSVDADDPNAFLSSTAAARLAFAPDGTLFMSMGGAFGVERDDGTSSFFGNAMLAQDPSSYAGKLLRLNADGTAPEDNPFYGREGFKPEIYSMGHRNQQGLALHPETGQPFATEHGVQGGDELNAIVAGGNYGWPVVSYGRHYDGPRIAKQFWQEGMREPLVFWVPSIAPSGLAFYTGDAFPEWKGNLFVGAMMEGRIPGTGHLERIVFNEHGEELRRESLLGEFRQRIRDVRQGPDGMLYLLTEENRSALIRLEPVEGPAD